MMKSELPMPPSGNHYKRHVCTRSTRQDPHRVTAYLTAEAKQFYEDVRKLAMVERWEHMAGKLSLTATLYIKGRMDADNAVKMLLDSMQGIVYDNDTDVVELHVYKRRDPKRPRVEVEIQEVDG